MKKHVRDMTPPEIERICARVFIQEARRRGQPFAATLLEWARNSAQRAREWRLEPAVQPDLFGGRP